jgi:hypothetical protein
MKHKKMEDRSGRALYIGIAGSPSKPTFEISFFRCSLFIEQGTGN